MSVSRSLVLLVTILLVAPPAIGQQDRQAVETMSSRWTPIGVNVRRTPQKLLFSSGEEVELGDPRLAVWAIHQCDRLEALSKEDFGNWLTICGAYGIAECEEPLRRLAPRLARMRMRADETRGTRTAAGMAGHRSRIFAVFAQNATDESRRVLRDLIDFESRIDEGGGLFDGAANHSARAYCAAGLVMLDDEAGRDHLVREYRAYLISFVAGRDGDDHGEQSRQVLEKMYDAGLVEQIEALHDDPAVRGNRARLDIIALLEKMRMNGMPLDELKEIAATPANDINETSRRHEAIRALGLVGTPDDIAFIEELPPHPQPIDDEYENDRCYAITMIRCRHWRTLRDED